MNPPTGPTVAPIGARTNLGGHFCWSWMQNRPGPVGVPGIRRGLGATRDPKGHPLLLWTGKRNGEAGMAAVGPEGRGNGGRPPTGEKGKRKDGTAKAHLPIRTVVGCHLRRVMVPQGPLPITPGTTTRTLPTGTSPGGRMEKGSPGGHGPPPPPTSGTGKPGAPGIQVMGPRPKGSLCSMLGLLSFAFPPWAKRMPAASRGILNPPRREDSANIASREEGWGRGFFPLAQYQPRLLQQHHCFCYRCDRCSLVFHHKDC